MFFSLVYIESKRETDKGKRKEQLLSLIFRNTNIARWSRYAVRILTSDKRWINEFSRIGIYKRRRHIIGAPPAAEFSPRWRCASANRREIPRAVVSCFPTAFARCNSAEVAHDRQLRTKAPGSFRFLCRSQPTYKTDPKPQPL